MPTVHEGTGVDRQAVAHDSETYKGTQEGAGEGDTGDSGGVEGDGGDKSAGGMVGRGWSRRRGGDLDKDGVESPYGGDDERRTEHVRQRRPQGEE